MKKKADILELQSLTNSLVFFAPVALLVRTQAGVSYSQFFVLQAALSLTILCFEIPTGFLSDKIGYKRSLVAAQLLLAVARVLLLAGFLLRSLPIFYAEAFVEGISCCFLSGTDSAYLYSLFRKDGFAAKRARINNFGTVGFLVSTVLYAPIYHFFGLTGLLVTTAAACGISLLLVIRFPKEPVLPKDDREKRKLTWNTQGIGTVFLMILLSTCFTLGSFLISFFYVNKLEALSIGAEAMTGIILAYSLAELLREPIFRVLKVRRYPVVLLLSAIVAGGAFAVFGAVKAAIPAIGLMVVLPLLLAIPGGIAEDIQNRYIDSISQEGNRAFILSVINMGGSILEVVFLLASSAVASVGITYSFLGVGVLMILAVLPVAVLARRMYCT